MTDKKGYTVDKKDYVIMGNGARSSITDEITNIAVQQGYDGPTPTTIAGAVDALTSALGGEPSGGTIAQAVHALGPNIGGGGSGGGLEPVAISQLATNGFSGGYAIVGGSMDAIPCPVYLSAEPLSREDIEDGTAMVLYGGQGGFPIRSDIIPSDAYLTVYLPWSMLPTPQPGYHLYYVEAEPKLFSGSSSGSDLDFTVHFDDDYVVVSIPIPSTMIAGDRIYAPIYLGVAEDEQE